MSRLDLNDLAHAPINDLLQSPPSSQQSFQNGRALALCIGRHYLETVNTHHPLLDPPLSLGFLACPPHHLILVLCPIKIAFPTLGTRLPWIHAEVVAEMSISSLFFLACATAPSSISRRTKRFATKIAHGVSTNAGQLVAA